jgi:formamidopyrimidine-DNA glycosylase
MLAFFAFVFLSSEDIMATITKLKASNKTKNYFEALLKIVNLPLPKTKAEIKRLLCEVPSEVFNDFLTFKEINDNCNTDSAKAMLKEILQHNEPYLISHLKISGNFLKSKGYNGLEIGKVLNKLQQLVINCPQANTRENLINEIDKISP